MILRFFHDYYPDEIARIMCVTRPAVKERLRLARAEARLYLEDPNSLTFLSDETEKPAKFTVGTASGDLRLELRHAIFNTSNGEHTSDQNLKLLYANRTGQECRELAHIVSCAGCLDEVNTILDTPISPARTCRCLDRHRFRHQPPRHHPAHSPWPTRTRPHLSHPQQKLRLVSFPSDIIPMAVNP